MPSEIAALNTFLLLMEEGLREVFDGSLKTHPELYHKWLAQRQAKEWIEDDVILSAFQSMPEKDVGDTFTIDRPLLGTEKEYTLKTYGLAYTIQHEAMKWDQYGKLAKPTARMAQSGVDRKNIIAYSILNNSTNASASAEYLTNESQAIVANTHVLLRGGSGSNAPSANLGLSWVGVQTAMTTLAQTENEDGLYAIVTPECLIVPLGKEWEAQEIVGSDYRPDNANMAKNSLKNRLSVHSAPYLTSTTRWWIAAAKNQLQFAFSIGEDLMFKRDYQIDTWNAQFSMYMSCRVEVLTWQGIWGTDGV